MAKNKTRKLKRYKRKNISQLIKIIARQNKKQDKLLQKIGELEEYLNFIEDVYVDDGEDVLISGTIFEADDVFEQILQDQLNETQEASSSGFRFCLSASCENSISRCCYCVLCVLAVEFGWNVLH